jgi:hypothetical protein
MQSIGVQLFRRCPLTATTESSDVVSMRWNHQMRGAWKNCQSTDRAAKLRDLVPETVGDAARLLAIQFDMGIKQFRSRQSPHVWIERGASHRSSAISGIRRTEFQ